MQMLTKKILTIIFVLWASVAGAVSWTTDVTQGGSGGACENGGECSAAEFNALSGDYSGSTFNFSGSFTTRITVTEMYGSSGNPVVLDGYQPDDTSCDPLSDSYTTGDTCYDNQAVLNQGLAIGDNTYGPDYITVKDFRMGKSGTSSDYALLIYPDYDGGTTDSNSYDDYWIEGVTVQRVYVSSTPSVVMGAIKTKYLTVEDSKFFGGATDVDSNSVAANFSTCEDTIVRRNFFGADGNETCTSCNTIEFHAMQRALFEYNIIDGYDGEGGTQQSNLSIKEGGEDPYDENQDDIIVRFNVIRHSDDTSSGKGIHTISRYDDPDGSITDVLIYGNLLYDNGVLGMSINDTSQRIHIWANVLYNHYRNGIYVWEKDGDDPEYIYIFNNTIIRSNQEGNVGNNITGISVYNNPTNVHIKNNILYDNRPDVAGGEYWQIYLSITPSALDYNMLYHPDSAATWYHDGAERTLAVMRSSYSFEANGSVEDPVFTNPTNDFTLQATSPAINGGVSISDATLPTISVQGTAYTVSYGELLDPNNTDFTAVPPEAAVIAADEQGAYAYGVTPQVIIIPTGF